jgi:hypothetical protein
VPPRSCRCHTASSGRTRVRAARVSLPADLRAAEPSCSAGSSIRFEMLDVRTLQLNRLVSS